MLFASYGKPISSVIANPDKKVVKLFFSKFNKKGTKDKEKVWVNLNRILKRCTIHIDPDCIYVINKRETQYKGIGKLKRNGGWIDFPDIESAQLFCKEFESKGYTKKIHC